nr:MAG TPA: hypothetical protein [Caudoviricetes sp.]
MFLCQEVSTHLQKVSVFASKSTRKSSLLAETQVFHQFTLILYRIKGDKSK